MYIAFELSMPKVGSWNGKWTGAGRNYVVVRKFYKPQCDVILAPQHYYYDFGDGWGMNISVRQVDYKTAAKLKKTSQGFCGYEWAISSIVQYGDIYNSKQIAEMATK